MKPFFTNKGINNEITLLIEVDETISDNKKISEKLNNFFANAVKNLNIPQYNDPSVKIDHFEDPIITSVEKFKNRRSIKLIKNCLRNSSICSFDEITISDIEKELKNLDSSKAAEESDLPIKIIKDDNIDPFALFCIYS